MSKKRELEIDISPSGEIHVHVKGYKGPACLEILKHFEKEIGEIVSQTLTSEYYEVEIVEDGVQIKEKTE